MGKPTATLGNALDFVALTKDLKNAGFATVSGYCDWNVLTVAKKKSAVEFSAEVYNDITKVPSGKAYVSVFMSYRAPQEPLPSIAARKITPDRGQLEEAVDGVQFDRILGTRSVRTSKQHEMCYQIGILVQKNAEEELRGAVCRTLDYVSKYVEKAAKQ